MGQARMTPAQKLATLAALWREIARLKLAAATATREQLKVKT